MIYRFDTNCVEFTHDEYQYLHSLSCLAPFTPAHNTWQMFKHSRGHMVTNSLHKLTDEYGNLSVSADFLYDNFFMIKLAHAAVDNSNIKFMHDLMEIILPRRETQ